ncbi:MAG: DUF502 domain-containing protein [Verrucomicrobia bacterium]|nr:DUF502 domain-containing protein [Verrucomicrobiota bacterium]
MKRHFITGMAILLPLMLTIGIAVFLVNLLTQPFLGMIDWLLHSQEWARPLYDQPGMYRTLRLISQILVLVFLFFAAVLLGIFARWFLIKWLLSLSDRLLHRIPVINKVYKTTQEIIKTLFVSKAGSFKTVVMVPFPRIGIYSIGLVVGDAPPTCKNAVNQSDLISVFLPTTPNPTSGYILMFPRADCLFIDMKVEEAVKFVISCGVIHEHSSDTSPQAL